VLWRNDASSIDDSKLLGRVNDPSTLLGSADIKIHSMGVQSLVTKTEGTYASCQGIVPNQTVQEDMRSATIGGK
jgi:hypothetical protein